jgi:cytidine deaminase
LGDPAAALLRAWLWGLGIDFRLNRLKWWWSFVGGVVDGVKSSSLLLAYARYNCSLPASTHIHTYHSPTCPTQSTDRSIDRTDSMMHPHPSPARAVVGLPSRFERHLDSAQEPPIVVAALNAYRRGQPLPYQSQFRVLALAIYKDSKGVVGCVVGANNESCVLSNSLCGERAALAQLRMVPDQPVELLRMYVVTDDAKPLFPGMLCRCVYRACLGLVWGM